MKPNFNEEKKLWRRGFDVVVGLDEAGRGALVGPVVAAAVMINHKLQYTNYKQYLNSKSKNSKRVLSLGFRNSDLFGICDLGFGISQVRDSKQLSEKKRGQLYEVLTNHSMISWGVGIVSEKVIDKINVLEATKLSMCKAIDSLNNKSQITNYKQILNSKSKNLKRGQFLLIDGNFGLKAKIPQKSIIKGDAKVFSIAAASIIAKVTRDRLMQKMHKKYPEYGFDRHKGYGTSLHVSNLANFGPCKIHRKTFFPVSQMVQ